MGSLYNSRIAHRDHEPERGASLRQQRNALRSEPQFMGSRVFQNELRMDREPERGASLREQSNALRSEPQFMGSEGGAA